MEAVADPLMVQESSANAGSPQFHPVVCHLIASNFAGGPEKQIIELSRQLSARGWTVIIGSFRENRPSVEVIEKAKTSGLKTFLLDTRSPFNPASITQLSRFLKQFCVDLLVTHGYKPNVVGYLAVRGTRTVQVPMIRGYTAEDKRIRVYEAIDRGLLRRFHSVLCVSEATRRLLAIYGIKQRWIHVLHNAVECDPLVEPIDLREEFDLPENTKVVLAAGRLSPEKGHRFLVDALLQLRGHTPLISVVILGEGRERAKLERQIHLANLSERVVLGGFRDRILRYLSGADLIVNPSLSEGLPNVLLEALSVRVPVVATDVGGVRELILPGKTGWLVPAADPKSLAGAIASALSDEAVAHTMAMNGYKLVLSSFSFKEQAARFAQICVDTLQTRSAVQGE